MKEEQIKERYGMGYPFKTPEGYFETLTDRVMAQIPTNEVVMHPHKKNRRWLSIAAICCVVLGCSILISRYVLPFGGKNDEMALATEENQNGSTTYVEDMVDYALISDAMIYYEYLSDEE